MKNKKIKSIIVIILGLLLMAYMINFFSNATNELSENPIKLEKKILTDYINLFKPQVQRNIVLQSVTSFKLRNTIVDAVYKNQYDIIITKVTVKSGFNLERDVIGIYKKSEGSAPQTNSSYNEYNFNVTYNGSSTSTISKIYLTLDGDSMANYHNDDSVAYYYSYLRAANLQYKRDGVNEVSIEAKKKFWFLDQKKPIIIMLVKRNDFLYIIILSGRNDGSPLDSDMLYKLIQ